MKNEKSHFQHIFEKIFIVKNEKMYRYIQTICYIFLSGGNTPNPDPHKPLSKQFKHNRQKQSHHGAHLHRDIGCWGVCVCVSATFLATFRVACSGIVSVMFVRLLNGFLGDLLVTDSSANILNRKGFNMF